MQVQSLDVKSASPGVDLGRLIAACPHIKAALVMGLDGDVRICMGPAAEALKTSISFGIGILDLAQRLSEEAGAGALRYHAIASEAGTLVLHHVDDETVAVLLADVDAPLGALLHDLQFVVGQQSNAEGQAAWS